MKRYLTVFAVIVMLLPSLVLALPSPVPPTKVTCDPLPAGDNDSAVYLYWFQGQTIVSISKATNGVVTTSQPHGLTTGTQIAFVNVGGMTQLNFQKSANNLYTATVTSPTVFSINVNTTQLGTFTAGGAVFDTIHLYKNGRIDTTPYDLLNLNLVPGTYPVAGTAFNGQESDFSNVINFTMPSQALPASPPNLRFQ